MENIIKFIEKLENQSFKMWSEEEATAYKTACKTIREHVIFHKNKTKRYESLDNRILKKLEGPCQITYQNSDRVHIRHITKGHFIYYTKTGKLYDKNNHCLIKDGLNWLMLELGMKDKFPTAEKESNGARNNFKSN